MDQEFLQYLATWVSERKYRNLVILEKEISMQAPETKELAKIIFTDYGTYMVHKTNVDIPLLLSESDCLSIEDALYETERWLTDAELDPSPNPSSRYCMCKGEYGGCSKMNFCYFKITPCSRARLN